MTIKLCELAGADPDMRYSPFCWRTRLALAHKGLGFEGIPWRLTDKQMIAFSGSTRVPVLVDGETVVNDSWRIAEYLDDAYPNRPSLLGPHEGRSHLRLLNFWLDNLTFTTILPCVLNDIPKVLAPQDQSYFRASREQRFGKKLEEIGTDRDTAGVAAFRAAIAPVRSLLAEQPWLGGAQPSYADYILLGSLQWARCVSRFHFLLTDDPVHAWHVRGMALFGGLLATAKIG